ncbi:hypothetical protein ScPMuIL_016466 [Solemya velum]
MLGVPSRVDAEKKLASTDRETGRNLILRFAMRNSEVLLCRPPKQPCKQQYNSGTDRHQCGATSRGNDDILKTTDSPPIIPTTTAVACPYPPGCTPEPFPTLCLYMKRETFEYGGKQCPGCYVCAKYRPNQPDVSTETSSKLKISRFVCLYHVLIPLSVQKPNHRTTMWAAIGVLGAQSV